MSKKETTNEDLARMVKKGFDGTDKRFDKMDQRLEKVDARLDNLEQGQDEIKLRLDNVAYRFEVEDVKKRVKKIEFKLGIRKAARKSTRLNSSHTRIS